MKMYQATKKAFSEEALLVTRGALLPLVLLVFLLVVLVNPLEVLVYPLVVP